MRVLHFLPELDIHELWDALTTDEDVVLVVSQHDYEHPNLDDAIGDLPERRARTLLCKRFKQQALRGLLTVLGSAAFILFISWPLIANLFAYKEMLHAVQVVGGLGVAAGILTIALGLRNFKKAAEAQLKIAQVRVSNTPYLIPWDKPRIKPLTWWPVVVGFGLALLANMTVVAGRRLPTVVWTDQPYITRQVGLVPPFTQWEASPLYKNGHDMVIIAAPDLDNIWVARVNWRVKNNNPLVDEGDWRQWIRNWTSSVTSNLTNQVGASAPPTSDPLALTMQIVSYIEALKPDMEQALTQVFNERYTAVQVREVNIEIEHISLNEWQTYSRSIQK